MASKQQHPLTSPHSSPPRIAIKLTPDAHKLQQQEGKHITKLVTKTDSGLGLKHEIKPLITSQPSDAVAQLVTRAAQLDPTYKPVNFNAWYQVEFDPEQLKSIKDDGSEGHEIRNELQRHAHRLHGEDDVESAHLVGTVCPLPVVNWKDNPRAQFEGYIDKAPGGIDAKFAWGFPGGDGAGTNVVDLERGWDLNHEDLAAAKVTLIGGDMRAVDVSHGTSVLGQILMADNRTGGIGIAPAAKGRVVSSWRSNQNNVASAILDAGVNMKLGDVLLLEAQEFNPMMDVTDELLAQNRGLLPVEVTQANYDAIRTLTGAGVIVVEAGANGTFDLDTYVSFSDKQIFKRSSNDFRDSGAIMVGAGSSAGSSTSPHTRMGWSNFGSRIDVFAWGENIDTTTSASDAGTTGVHNQYTTTFAGTSGASPIITGAALIVQGIAAKTPKGRKLLPLQVRKILTTSGTPSATPASDKIGVMPDLKAIISGGSIKAALGA